MIEIANLSKRHGSRPALRDINLTIPAGGITAIIGPNGAGKSTLLHCMAGLLAPDTGSIHVDGTDIHAVTEADRALLLALLTQSQGTVPRLTVRELVGFGRWPHHRGRPGLADKAVSEDAIERFDLSDIAENEVETLSGGQKQRAFVAMAYAQSTDWLFLDEPLAALDPKFTRDIMDRLRQAADDRCAPRNIVLVLHDLQIAARYADRVICLKNGELTNAGLVVETLTSAVLSSLYDTPLQVSRMDDHVAIMPGESGGPSGPNRDC